MNAERKQASGAIASDNSERMTALADEMDLVGMYLEEVVMPSLTAEEEKEFARRIKKGAKAKELLEQGNEDGRGSELLAIVEDGEVAREHFTEANLPLVVWVAKKYRGKGLSFLDLIQEGNVGLVKAVNKFDDRGNRFATYAVYLIKKDIREALSDKSRIIRRPRHINDQMAHFCETIRQLEQRLGRKPTVEEIAAATKFRLPKVKRMTSLPRDPMSLEEISRPGGDTERIEFIEDESAEVPAESAERGILREKIEELLLLLPSAREAKIIRLWCQKHSLREIGDMLDGISRERVRQLRNQALRRLREFPGTEELRIFLQIT